MIQVSTLQSSPSSADSITAPEALDREKALVLAAVAARTWCGRAAPEAPPGRELVARLMEAAAWVSRARRHRQLAPVSIAALTEAFERPVWEWLPEAGAFALVEDAQPTPLCIDYAEDAGSSAILEVEQRVIKVAMGNISGRPDAAEVYTRFRRFLVENAHTSRVEAGRAVRSVGLELGHVFGEVAGDARLVQDTREVFYPCPRCHWPMTVRGESVSCRRSPSCLAAGASYSLRSEGLVALGRFDAPAPVRCEGAAALLPGVWRYTVLPGLEELHLAASLARVGVTRVELWPFIDAYDLDVLSGNEHWRVDVKDHVSAMRLAKHLAERPTREPTWIVVPDQRRDQVPVLRANVPREAGYFFAYTSEFVRRVKGAA